MQTYVTLGIGQGKRQTDEVVRETIEKAGGRLIGGYLLMGQYDYLMIFQAPDAHVAAMVVYAAKHASGLDGKPSQTLLAFSGDDIERFQEIAEKIGLQLDE